MKNSLFLLVSMIPWLLVGAALIYLSPVMFNWVLPSEMTAQWMVTLDRSGYYPNLAIAVGGMMAAVGTGMALLGQSSRS
ncbi:MAG: hypothetical protein VKJ24_03575 [Synechococcales bacterium]|nr:hypothetical protein [Synechococcales bacterium]